MGFNSAFKGLMCISFAPVHHFYKPSVNVKQIYSSVCVVVVRIWGAKW